MSGENAIGVNVWWHVPEVAVEVGVAKNALESHGFSVDAMKEPSRRNEVSRAVRSLQDCRTRDQQTIARPTNDNGVAVTYGVLDEGHVDDDTVEFKQGTTVRLNKETGEVGVEGCHADAVEEAIRHYTGKITDEDIRIFLRMIIRKCRGVAKRPTGGIYFVPERFTALIERAQSVLDAMNCGALIYIEGVVNGIRERQNVWTAVEREIGSELDKALASVDRISRSTKCLKGHEAKIASLQQMMEVYTALLGEQAEYEAIAERISGAVETVAHKLTELQAGTASVVKRVASKGSRGPTMYDAAVDVLVKTGTAMNYRDILKAMVEAGTYAECETAVASVRGMLQRRAKDADSRIEKVGRGMYKVVPVAA